MREARLRKAELDREEEAAWYLRQVRRIPHSSRVLHLMFALLKPFATVKLCTLWTKAHPGRILHSLKLRAPTSVSAPNGARYAFHKSMLV